MRKIVAIGGNPGSGKTSLFKSFMKNKEFTDYKDKLVSAHYNKTNDLYILGRYVEGEIFSGTDRLSMAVQPQLQAWLIGNSSNVLFEGDRVFNSSFLEFCSKLPNTKLEIIYLNVDQTMLKERYKERNSNQSDKFLQGRETKYNNILSNFDLREYITEFQNKNLEEQSIILKYLEDTLCQTTIST